MSEFYYFFSLYSQLFDASSSHLLCFIDKDLTFCQYLCLLKSFSDIIILLMVWVLPPVLGLFEAILLQQFFFLLDLSFGTFGASRNFVWGGCMLSGGGEVKAVHAKKAFALVQYCFFFLR